MSEKRDPSDRPDADKDDDKDDDKPLLEKVVGDGDDDDQLGGGVSDFGDRQDTGH